MIAFVCEWCKEKALYSTRREQNPNPSLRPMDHYWAVVSPRLEKDDTWRHVCDKLDLRAPSSTTEGLKGEREGWRNI